MMLQTGGCHCFPFLILLFSLHLNPILAYFMKDCTFLYSDNVSAGVSVGCGHGHGPGIVLVSLVPDDIPRDVISLDLIFNLIQKIHRTDFYHLTNLRDLDLSYNSITHVDDGAFVPLVQLKVLYMSSNKLTTLTDNMFQGLSNLLILSLDGNDITSINPAAFQSLTSLQELSLMSNNIIDIITILKLPSLQVLNISTDELVSFQSKDLPLNMSSELRELRIISGSIKTFSITTAVFPHLKTIDLSDCCSYSGWEWDIPDKYFRMNITTLYLSGGGHGDFNDQIRNITQALQNLDSLVNLGLRFRFKDPGWIDRDLLNIVCKISTLRTLSLDGKFKGNISETLSPCTQLTSLDLSHNKLTELSNGSIKHMNQLSQLNLANNQLSKVPDDVMNLSMLQILDLRYNLIENLSCSDFLNLTRITHLHLDENNIAELQPCVFQHLKELKVLTLYGNGFIMMSKGEFMSLKSLKQLEFSYARACDLWNSNSLEGLDELETLSLDFMYSFKMTSLPPHVLLWQHNNTTLLPNLKSLTVIFDLTYIVDPFDVPFLWDMLSDMKHLEHIYVAATPRSNVYRKQPDPDSFKHVPQLKTLSLINFNLTSLDFLTQAYLPRLSWLDLSQNELTVINVVVFSFLPALRYINMNDNPFNCSDCSNADFLQWMQNTQILVVDAHRYTCAFPLDKKGTRFLDFDYHSCFVDNSFTYFISSTCVIVLTLLTSFTCHFLSLHLLYAFYLFLAFLYDANKGRKRGAPERYDAFISYNVHDELWVCREMLPVLEGEQGWRLCLHHRDFIPGKPIIDNITDAIYGSRKTICVISHHYLESEWCSREFQMASYRLFDEQKDVLILVFLEDIPAHKLSPRLRRLMKSHTYLSWSQAGQHPGLFWQNLRRALDTPHTDLDVNQ